MSTAKGTAPDRATRVSHLQWVPIADMTVSPLAQREYRQSKAEKMAAAFDLEAIGFPVVSKRNGHYYIVDGQHRVGALRLIGFGDLDIQCEVYEGLDEAGEAHLFDRRNDRTAVRPFDRFKVRITAEEPIECDIDRIVRANGLRVSQQPTEGSVAAVSTLRKLYLKSPEVLGRTLRIIQSSFGDRALRGEVIDGVGLVCHRYNGELDESTMVDQLSKVKGGIDGLLHNANLLRKQLGRPRADCIAGAVVESLNRGKGGRKLPSWWSA